MTRKEEYELSELGFSYEEIKEIKSARAQAKKDIKDEEHSKISKIRRSSKKTSGVNPDNGELG